MAGRSSNPIHPSPTTGLRRVLPRAAVLVAAGLLGGCRGWQSALDPHGPYAHHLERLIIGFSVLLGAIWLAVVVAMLIALFKRDRATPPGEPLATRPQTEARAGRIVAALSIATGVIVLGLTGVSFSSQNRLFVRPPEAVVITLTGHRW